MTAQKTQAPAVPVSRRERSIRRASMRFALLLPAMLYACGVAMCLIIGQQLDMRAGSVIFWCCACVFALAVVTYNHWTLAGTAVLLGIAALFIWRLAEPEDLELLAETVLFHSEYVSSFLFGDGFYDPAYDTWLLAYLVMGCSLLSVLVLYHLRSALLSALLALALLMIEWNLGSMAVLSTLWPIAIACAAVFAIRGYRRSSAHPIQSVALAVAVALVACGTAFSFVPQSTERVRSPAVERVLDNVGDLFSEYTGYQRPHSSFSIASVGYQPLEDRLGGAVQLSNEELLRVDTLSPHLLRGMVRNFYTGKLWLRSASIKTYRMDNPFMRPVQERIMGTDLPVDSVLMERFSRNINLTVTHRTFLNSTIFTTGRVHTVSARDNDVITNFDENAEAFSKRTLNAAARYTVNASMAPTDPSTLDSAMRSAYQEGRIEPTPEDVRERNAFLYLGLPDDFPVWVRDLAASVIDSADAQTEWEKARALQEFLLDNFTYTLSPVDPPDDVDFVEHFLRTGEGYCTYFASALAVMARTQGLPSRYVEGFLLPGSSYTQQGYLVTGKQAHAWVEIYIEGLGWMPFDATPRQTQASTPSAWAATVEMPTPTPPPFEPGEISGTDLGQAQLSFLIPWWVWPSAALVALVALFFILLSRHNRRWDPESLYERQPDESARVVMIWRDILHVHSLRGFPLEPGETPLTYARRVDESVENPEGKLYPLAQAYVRTVYGNLAPNEKLLGAALAYRGEADVALRKSTGRVRFLFLRALRPMPRGARIEE